MTESFEEVQPSGLESDAPVLRGLGAEYQPELHARHAAVLLAALTAQSGSVAKNIALAGHYGSGKSSVILGVQDQLDELHVNWVNLSLSSLGIDDTIRARVQSDGTVAPLTNLIQKEIVKQLLYRKSPADMPASRYRRIDEFRSGPAALWAGAVGVAFFLLATLLGLVGRVEVVAPRSVVEDRGWAPWAIVAAVGVFVGALWFLGLRTLQNGLRVESVSAGGAAISLSAKENSFFDEFLDEIVYFFQTTETKVAVFEDLDRFKDPHIFETLRELNTVLNNSEQIGERPIRFVYAVRDSIFEQLEVGGVPNGDGADEGATTGRASFLESAPSANRTKFFDLVIPMVPFITHRSARDLLAAEFSESDEKPSAALVSLVGTHLTDMRLIRNIRNEFEMYRSSVLGAQGLNGLTVDRLFAMMVYKNLHLDDFEAIRLGTSAIDRAHRAFRSIVDYQVGRQNTLSTGALRRAESSALWDDHANLAGTRLQAVLPIFQRVANSGGTVTVAHQSTSYQPAEWTSGAFWRALFESRGGVSISVPGWQATTVSFEEFVMLAGDDARAMDRVVEADAAALRKTSRASLETKDFVARATMAQMVARSDLTMTDEQGEQSSLEAIMRGIVSPLALELLATGYIDENYTLYCSDYHAIAISVSAMNFILHSVQEDRADHRFRFDDPSSIDAVEKEMGERFLDGESIFNIEVFDHYLGEQPARLDKALNKLSLRVATDTSFLDSYLVDGAAPHVLVGQLSRRWKGIFIHLVEHSAVGDPQAIALVDAAVQSALPDFEYESSNRVGEFFAQHFGLMDAFVSGDIDPSRAADTASLLGGLSTQIPDLAILGDSQRRAVVSAGSYPITRANLMAALGKGADLALDLVKANDEAVYRHLLANLADYLGLLESHEVTVAENDGFVAVLADTLRSGESLVPQVAAQASESCEVLDLTALDEAAWPALVSSGRFAASACNVHLVITELGVTDGLLTKLVACEVSEVEDLYGEARYEVAYALINSARLDPAERVRLGVELQLSGPLDRERLTDAGLAILADLVAGSLVPDSAATYGYISHLEYESREAYLVSSKKLPSYVTELELSSEDLARVMRSRQVEPEVKIAIVDDVEFVDARLSRLGAIAICEWANKGYDVSLGLLVVLSRADAPAEHVLHLLEPHLPDVELHVLDEILVALGDEYEPLTRVGHHRPRVKERAGTEKLLNELKRRGRVSSFNPSKWGSGIRVNMRH